MTRLLQLAGCMLAGLAVALATGVDGLDRSRPYALVTTALLAIGLFSSASGIDLRQARGDLRTILLAITVGVVLKALLIGGVLYLFEGDPRSLLFGVAVAQIDPLSVAAIMRSTRMSPRAKSVLAAWSSFDDPMTVLLTVYVAALTVGLLGPGGVAGGVAGLDHATTLGAYAADLGLNLAFAAAAYGAWRLVRGRPPALVVAVLLALGAVAVWQFLMLAVALAGLFFRPPIERHLDRVTTWAFLGAAVLLGLLLRDGADLGTGLLLGASAFAAQIAVGALLTVRLPAADRVHLALAQQNGITAILLALLLEAEFSGTVAVVAPAIITVNLIHLLANAALDRWTRRATAAG